MDFDNIQEEFNVIRVIFERKMHPMDTNSSYINLLDNQQA